MRSPAFFALLFAATSLASTTARADYERIEAPVTLSLTLTRTGDEQSRATSGGGTTVTANLERQRVGNAQIIEAMHTAGLIEETRGWQLIALWDDFDGEGLGYRFHLRRGSGASAELVEVPSDRLQLASITTLRTQTLNLSVEQDIRSGSVKTESLRRLICDTGGFYFNVNGLFVGSGRHVRIANTGEVRYLPGAIKGSLRGLHEVSSPGQDGNARHGVAEGTIKIGAAKRVVIRENTGGPDISIPVSVN